MQANWRYTALFTFFGILFYILSPYQWKENKIKKTFLLFFLILGTFCISLGLFICKYLSDGFIKNFIIYYGTIYVGINVASVFINLVRNSILYILTRNNCVKAIKFFNKPIYSFIVIVAFASIYVLYGLHNCEHLVYKEYDLTLNEGNNSAKIAFITDLHVGTGMRTNNIDLMIEMLNSSDCEALLVGGDIFDTTTSKEDIEYFCESIKKIKMPIYYIEGNHEIDCVFDYQSCLENFICLYDDAVLFKEGLVLVGRKVDTDVSIKKIIESNNLENNEYIIVKHKPTELDQIDIDNALVLCGHSHGYRLPNSTIGTIINDVEYGKCYYENNTIIVSSGVSGWGYHATFPTKNEIIICNIRY